MCGGGGHEIYLCNMRECAVAITNLKLQLATLLSLRMVFFADAAIVCIICFVVHYKAIINEVKRIRSRLERTVDHFFHWNTDQTDIEDIYPMKKCKLCTHSVLLTASGIHRCVHMCFYCSACRSQIRNRTF